MKKKTQAQIEKDFMNDETVEVLYQKMGDRWFAFSLVGDEVYVGSITQAEVDGANAPALAEALPANTQKSA